MPHVFVKGASLRTASPSQIHGTPFVERVLDEGGIVNVNKVNNV
jgi:hypothetical protein